MTTKIILISDNHFSENNKLLFNAYDVEQNIRLLDDLIKRENPHYIFVLGDISQDGTVPSYQKAKIQFEKYHKPVYFIPGNHDSTHINTLLDSTYTQSVPYLDIAKHRFIFLDSTIEGSDSGYLSPQELDKIRIHHNKQVNNHLIIHHHFLPLNSIIDNYILTNNQELILLIEELNIRNAFTGHVHNGLTKTHNLLNIHHCPATCVQFGLTKELTLENIIGYRVINLEENVLNSYCKRIPLDK